jgi:ketosteroid isomerase-like protein
MNRQDLSAPSVVTKDRRLGQVIAFFETLTPDTLQHLDRIYADTARFTDPFNDVSGIADIRRVFQHMFETLDSPQFHIVLAVTEGDHAFLLWNFRFRRQGRSTAALIHGSTHLRFAADGRIAWHRDYWDPAREVYESLPLLGAVMRWLRRRLSAAA